MKGILCRIAMIRLGRADAWQPSLLCRVSGPGRRETLHNAIAKEPRDQRYQGTGRRCHHKMV